MVWPATDRYELSVVPGELGLVQDFLNTIEEGSDPRPDLLGTLSRARSWARDMASEWRVITGDATLEELRELADQDRLGLIALRERLFVSLFGQAGEGDPLPPSFEASQRPAIMLRPGGVSMSIAPIGWEAFELVVLLALYGAQLTGATRRMKTCRSHDCNIVFYDRSPNNSAVWHDVKTCGNRANVRSYRARAAGAN